MTNKEKIKAIDLSILEKNEELKNVKGTETEVYTRIVGYHRALDSWNKGKREEYKDRTMFSVGGVDFDGRQE